MILLIRGRVIVEKKKKGRSERVKRVYDGCISFRRIYNSYHNHGNIYTINQGACRVRFVAVAMVATRLRRNVN